MEFLHQLNTVQRDAVSALDGPVLIVAGAGSGKTRVLTYRVAQLIARGTPPHEILALTFTNKAAKEMKDRIASLVGNAAAHIWAGTFHSMLARVLRHEATLLGYGRNFTIYDAEDSLALIKNVMGSLNLSQQLFVPRSLQSRISGAKNQLVTPETYESVAKDPSERATARVFAEYQRRLLASNAMDFDDLLLKPIELFRRFPGVLEKYQYRFRHILVDEYQDTNRAQYVLIHLLAERFRNVCVVGDDAQSIYAFRGADIRNILDFERDYPDCKVFRLEQNYRSTKTILAAADTLIRHNKDQIPKKLWTSNASGDPIALIEAEDEKDEGSRIARHVEDLCTRLKLGLREIAILYRTNSQSRAIEDALRRGGIPYVIVGGTEFYKRKEIKDVLAYLRLVVNPRDDESVRRVLNVPARGIGDTTLQKIDRFARSETPQPLSLLEAMHRIETISTIADRTRKAVAQFVSFVDKYSSLRAQMSASEVAHALVDELGILKILKEEATPEAIVRWENIRELISAISEYSTETPDASLEDFLEEVSLVSTADEQTGDRNAVTLMTLHAAKGLEFPVVFISGLEEGLLPLYQSTPDPRELEEERRLFYVGMTRAMHTLFLSHARLRFRAGDVTYPILSRFAEEIDETLLSREMGTLSPSVSAAYAGNHRHRTPAPYRSVTKGNGGFVPDQTPDYENESQEVPDFHVGAIVEHESFGRGKILQIAGKGERAKAVVLFDTVGPKNLMLKYARLRGLQH